MDSGEVGFSMVSVRGEHYEGGKFLYAEAGNVNDREVTQDRKVPHMTNISTTSTKYNNTINS